MSWQDDSRNLLRTVCGDVGPVYEYDDSRLDDLILYAAKFVLTETFLTDTYTLTLSTGVITPDPVGDNWFISLLVLKAWDILAKNEYRIASQKALVIRDGASTIDGKGVADNKKVIAEKAAKDYSDAILTYNINQGSIGCAVMSPFRVYDSSTGNSFFS